MQVSQAGIDLIKELEGFSATPYVDAHGYSIGYGSFIDTPEEEVYHSRPITREEAEQLLREQVRTYAAGVADTIRVPLAQNQFDALTSFAYNVGTGNFRSSTLAKRINESAPIEEVEFQWRKWTRSQGQHLEALARRREKELALFKASPLSWTALPGKKKPWWLSALASSSSPC